VPSRKSLPAARGCHEGGGGKDAGFDHVHTVLGVNGCKDQSRNNFPISGSMFDPKPQAMVF